MKKLLIVSLVLFPLLIFSQTTQMSDNSAAYVKVETPKNWAKDKQKIGNSIYNAPKHCTILKANINTISANGPCDASIKNVAAGSRYISTTELNDAFSNAKNLAVSLKIKGDELADLNAKLDTKYSEYEKIQNQVESTHRTIELIARCNGAGAFNGRSWWEGKGSVQLLCCEDYVCSKPSLENHLSQFVNDYKKNTASEDGKSEEGINSSFLKSNLIYILGGIIIIILLILFFRKKK